MSLISTPRPPLYRHCLTVPAVVAGSAEHARATGAPAVAAAAAPAVAAAPVPVLDAARPLTRRALRHPQAVAPAAETPTPTPAPAPAPAPAVTPPPPPPIALPLPPAAVAVVGYHLAAGDTLDAVARTHGVTVDALLAANALGPGAILYPGERILVPLTRMPAASA